MGKATKTSEVSQFEVVALEGLNKTQSEQVVENVRQFIEDARVECETQISIIKVQRIPTLQNELKRQKVALVKAEKAFQKSRFTTSESFEDYVRTRERNLDYVDDAKGYIANTESQIQMATKELETLESILADLH